MQNRVVASVGADRLARLLGGVRVAAGVAFAARPGPLGHLLVGSDADGPGARLFIAAFGARDALLGAGISLATDRRSRRGWLIAAGLADAFDALATVAGYRRLPPRRRALTLVVSAAPAALNLDTARRLRDRTTAARPGAASPAAEPTTVAEAFVEAFSAADFDAMRELLDADLVAYVTNAEGGTDEVRGRDSYLQRIEAMDLPAARFGVEPTQPPAPVDAERALIMVEVRAERGGRHLHNFAAHLLRVADGRITEWRMVDAKPAESDRFWA